GGGSAAKRPGWGGGGEETRLMFMMSSGGLTAAELFRGKDAILSGPAGGVVGMAAARRAVSRRPGSGGRQSRAEMLSPRRSAGGDRRQCHGRQAHPGFLSKNFRTL